MWRLASAGAAALGFLVAFVPLAREAAAQTIGQPIRLHSADQRVNVVTVGVQQLRPGGGGTVATLAPSSALPDGGFVVAWQSPSQDGNGLGVFARRFDVNGTPLDVADIQVNVTTHNDQYDATVAGRPDGGFVVTWVSRAQAGDGPGIFVRRFAADGVPLDISEFKVNVFSSTEERPVIASRSDGSFAVVWASQFQDGSLFGIFMRRFAGDGSPLDAVDIPVNFATANVQFAPSIAARPDGSFVIAWFSRHQGNEPNIFARRFDVDGKPLDAADIAINFHTSQEQIHPTVAARPDGSFIVSWMSEYQDGHSYGVFARRFAADGTPLDAADIPVNVTTSRDQYNSAVATRSDGSFLVTWQSYNQDGSHDGIFARRFAANGTALDASDIAVNLTWVGPQERPSVALLSNDNTVTIVWGGYGGPEDNDLGIFFNRFRVAGTPVARDDSATATQPGSVVINVLANDADPDVGDTLTVVAVGTTVGGGNVVINGDNTLTYTPPAGCGLATDSFTYTIRDSTGKEATATVSVTINQVPAMSVSPVTGVRLYGQRGGPFPPPHGTYTVSNVGCGVLNWDTTRSATWIGRLPASGTLNPGASTSVSVYPGAGAPPLLAGEHRGKARFRNLSNGMGTTDRVVILRVLDAFGSNGFSGARLLSGASGSTWGSNVGGSGQPGEPDHAGVSLPLASVWWSWTAPASGRAAFHTTGSTFDTVLSVYTGTAVNALTLVAANDDDPALAPQSRVAFNAVAGTTYRIVVDGKGDATGQIRLNWSLR